MPKTHLRARLGQLTCLLSLLPLLILFASCAEDDPTEPTTSNRVSLVIDSAGGVLSLENKIHLYVPEGVVSGPANFELEEINSPPAAPVGFVQEGPSFTATSDAGGFGGTMALAMEFESSYLGEMTGKMVRLSRLAESGEWEAVDQQGTSFPLGLGATVLTLGTFAAHIDTSVGDPDEVYANISLSSAFGMIGSDPGRGWRTYAGAAFFNSDQTQPLSETGGDVLVGDFDLGPGGDYCYYLSSRHEVDPGSSYDILVPGGDEVPYLKDSLEFFDEELVLTNPSDPGLIISRLEPFPISWDGAGPQMVGLAIYGEGADGSILSIGKMRPNTGEFLLTPEDMAGFAENALVTIYLSRTQAIPLVHEDFHRASYYYVESISSMKINIQ